MTNGGQRPSEERKRPFVTSYFGLVLVSIGILLILIFTPVFYVVVRKFFGSKKRSDKGSSPNDPVGVPAE